MRIRSIFLCVFLRLALTSAPSLGCSADVAGMSPVRAWMAMPAQKRRQFPIPPQLQVGVVIPVYRELDNINKLIRAFTRQTVAANRFRLVFVVNNTHEVAIARNKIWRENRDIVTYLSSLAEGEFPLIGDIRGVNQALDKKLAIDVLDRTDGFPRAMGPLRGVGVDRAFYLHNGSRRNIIITHFDADSIPPDGYVEQVLQEFADPSVNFALFAMQFRIPFGGSADQHATYYRARAHHHLQDFHMAETRRNPFGGAPRIAIRGSYLDEIGGMGKLKESEDDDLIRRAAGPLNDFPVLWRDPVITADRMRRDSFDGQWRQTSLSATLMSYPSRQAAISENLKRVRVSLDYLRDRTVGLERELLEREIEFWRETHRKDVRVVQANLARLREGYAVERQWPDEDADWETVGNAAFWSETPEQALRLNWTEYEEGTDGSLSQPMETNVLAIALSRFLETAREYPEDFPATTRYLAARRIAFLTDRYSVYAHNPQAVPPYQRSLERLLSRSDLRDEDLVLILDEGIFPLFKSRSEITAATNLLLAELPFRQSERKAPLEERVRYGYRAAYFVDNILRNWDAERTLPQIWNEWAQGMVNSAEAMAILVLAYPEGEPLDASTFAVFDSVPASLRGKLRDNLLALSRRTLPRFRQNAIEAALEKLHP